MNTGSTENTLSVANIQTKLTKEQKEAVGILSIGTFLEYLDLKIYIHLAVMLNPLFFPPTDQFSASLLSAFAFCTSFVFRPFGGLLFGWLGDTIGRKNTIFLTTFFMGASCFIMFILPEYSKIGIWASVIMILCRIIQGMSSLGEVIGAKLYISEFIKAPMSYAMLQIVTIGAILGGSAAIFLSKVVIDNTGNWRYIFLIGSIIAFLGLIFRTRLRETPDFVDANKRLKKDQIIDEKIDRKLLLSYFFMRCISPFSIYVSFAYAPVLLKKHGYSMSEILSQNLGVTLVDTVFTTFLIYVSYKLHPLKILRFITILYIPVLLILIPLLDLYPSPQMIFLFQIFTMCCNPGTRPAEPIIYKSFPVFKRFQAAGIIFGLAGAVMYIISSFGVEIITSKYGEMGLYIIAIPLAISYVWGLNNFIDLEKKRGTYSLFNK
jgi:MFS transporter, MHS family, proline/betaine transporter